jgi:hypothetical protein
MTVTLIQCQWPGCAPRRLRAPPAQSPGSPDSLSQPGSVHQSLSAGGLGMHKHCARLQVTVVVDAHESRSAAAKCQCHIVSLPSFASSS